MAVCDSEEAYARSFLEYLQTRKRPLLPFELRAFTGVNELKAYAAEHEIEILLIAERTADETIRSLPAGKLIVLSEGMTPPFLEDCPRVYKYQSSDTVVGEVLDLYGAERLAAFAPVRPRSRQRMIAVYSPSGYSQRMLFSLALGQALAQKQAALFVCLDSYSGLAEMMNLTDRRTLSDLLYGYRRAGDVSEERLRETLCQLRNLDFLPPALTPDDLQMVSGHEWTDFLESLMQAGRYAVLILDLGDAVRELPELLESCDEVWLPTQTDVLSSVRCRQFEETVKGRRSSLGAKMKTVYPPHLELMSADRQMLEDLYDGEQGAFVRKLLRQEII